MGDAIILLLAIQALTEHLHLHGEHIVCYGKGELALSLQPIAEFLTHLGHIHHSMAGLQESHCLLDVLFLLVSVAVALSERGKGSIGHLG